MMKKFKLTFTGALLMIPLLCSCGVKSPDSSFAEKARERAGIYSDADYVRYNELLNSSKLKEGYYPLPSSSSVNNGTIHVTFAQNEFISVNYYKDPEHKISAGNSCYINPGDTIYASKPVIMNKDNSMYLFEGFRATSISPEGRRFEDIEMSDKDGVVFTLPKDYIGTEISVEPLGKYGKRSIKLKAYILYSEGKKADASGIWTVDEARMTGDTADLDPLKSYTVKYTFDKTRYYYSSSSPEKYRASDEDGIVEFMTSTGKDSADDYSVTLSPYTRVVFEGASKDILKKNFKDLRRIAVNNYDLPLDTVIEKGIKNLKAGDTVTVDLNTGFKLEGTQMTVPAPSNVDDYIRYEIKIPVPAENRQLINLLISGVNKNKTSEYTPAVINNGKVNVSFADASDSYKLTEGNIVEGSRLVNVSIVPDEGFYIEGKDVTDNVYRKTMKYSAYKSDIEKIISEHPIHEIREVNLITYDEYGTVTYEMDGQQVSGRIKVTNKDITLSYKITDKNHVIARNDTGVKGFFNKLFRSRSETVTIKASSLKDGQDVKRSDYIKTEEK